MARIIGEVSLAVELWTAEVQQRFDSLFAVAARKSLSAWNLVPKHSAEVLVLDGSRPLPPQGEITAPCVVYVGGEASGQPLGRSSQGWAAHLDVDFTLSDLIDILDRSAVFLMDWRARHRPSAVLTLSRALDELKQHGFDCVHRFQLRSWVALPASANTAANMRVLALLSRGPIDAKSMSDHSGMDLPQLLALLSLSQVQAVLRCSAGSPAVASAAPKLTKTQPATSATRQWVSKLTGWITRGGRS